MAKAQETTLVGWHGISVRVPVDWALAAVGGDDKTGYLRVDDQRMPRLQVKWSKGHINLRRKREEYAKRLTFAKRRLPGRKKRTGLEVDADARVLSHRSKPKKELAGFAWRGRHCGMGILWNCEVCNRAVIAQVSWLPEEQLHETAREVLGSLEDHGTEGWRWWGLDGLSFLAPEGYLVQRQRRLSRHLELRLGTNQARVTVARWGMVELVLEGRTLAEWFAERNRGRKDVVPGLPRWQTKELDIKGHKGLAAWGELRRMAGGVRKAVGRALRRPAPLTWAACAWHCPEANRLYLVESVEPEQGEVLKGVVDSVICHPAASATGASAARRPGLAEPGAGARGARGER